MTLLACFNPLAGDGEDARRRIRKAVNEPGVVVSLPAQPGWGDASAAATTLLMTLPQRETPVWLDSGLHSEALLNTLHLHTGASVSADKRVPFALLHTESDIAPDGFCHQLSAEKRTTLIIEVAALSGGLTLRLRGPSLRETRAVAPRLSETVLHYLRQRPQGMAQRVDLIFTCKEKMMALPSTTDVQVC
ncbi:MULTISPECIES: phosphonate C-P lyase system protein PhnH [Erwinia]|uniref:Phosphonate C-P lyase system protein PhnH n=1 Tax=Erwinia papayae TaxID=206499 RepID=A0ABV3MVZ6_9GAMM|nr:phosphonate C-P lyase system protein PhnH [Erwinia mallotivora]